MTEPVVLIVLLLPLAWSALVAGLRRLAGPPLPDDRAEKYQLLIMVTPILMGAAWIVLAPLLSISLPLPLPSLDDGAPSATAAPIAAVAMPARRAIEVGPWLAAAALMAWGVGALIRTVPLIVSLVRLGRIAARAGRGQIDGAHVRLTEARVPPLALGRATILLPAGLAAEMAPEELRLIVRHEQAHLDRGDPFYFTLLGLLDAWLWFNPFLHAQTRRCRLAAELTCDARASGKSAMEREAYARVLIRTLKHTAGNVRQHAPAAISNVKSGDYRMRLSEIMHADPAARKPKRRGWYVALAAALVPVAFVQFAWAQGNPAPVVAPAAASTTPPTTVMQLPAAGGISSGYGLRKDPFTGKVRFHAGIDIAAPVGTPVLAAADGKVGAIYSDKRDGKVLEIAHGGPLKTRMTHLDQVKVKWGDRVTKGQVIATVGNTGSTTGPHLHFEVWKGRKTVDPATMLPLARTGA